MQLKLTARHDHLSEDVRRYAETKLAKLDRRLHDLALVELTFSREHNPSIADGHTVDAVVHTKGSSIVARESASTYEAAVDRLVDKLERQIERYRDKRTQERRRPNAAGAAAAEPLDEAPRGAAAG
jgi:putative sigma-54 modulation protein